MNGNMPAPTAAAFIGRPRCADVLTDPTHRALLDGANSTRRWLPMPLWLGEHAVGVAG
jgi:hypothetical protein